MPPTTATTAQHNRLYADTYTSTSTTIDDIVAAVEKASVEEASDPGDAPIFVVQQNTQAAELRELRSKYPEEIFNVNYQLPTREVLRAEREEIRQSINRARRFRAACEMYASTPAKYRRHAELILSSGGLLSRELRRITSEDPADRQVAMSRHVASVSEALQTYRHYRDQHNTEREQYLPLQAQYNQRAAMIRQKPRKEAVINTYDIIQNIINWDHVWGAGAYHNTDSDTLFFRIGLSDIVMSESALTSRYDYKADILLAPFYFTLRFESDGNFVCQSPDGAARGLSRQSPGDLYYDFHPHQLSDSPCFGSFGQTLIDTAAKGDIITLISGIIAFYSQYNSQDSAGVDARLYHPACISNISDIPGYISRLRSGVQRFTEYYVTNNNKLTDAVTRYTEYYAANRNMAAPEREETYYCASCSEVTVNDGEDYYRSAGDERICPDCWHEHYCHDCENYHEDCTCEDEGEY